MRFATPDRQPAVFGGEAEPTRSLVTLRGSRVAFCVAHQAAARKRGAGVTARAPLHRRFARTHVRSDR